MLQKCLAQPKPNDVDKRNLMLSLSEQEECEPAKYLLTPKITALGVLEVLDGLSKDFTAQAEVLFNKICQCKHTLGMEGSGMSKSPAIQFQGNTSKMSSSY